VSEWLRSTCTKGAYSIIHSGMNDYVFNNVGLLDTIWIINNCYLLKVMNHYIFNNTGLLYIM